MKKIYSLIAALAFPALAWASVALPYGPANFTALGDVKNDDGWTKKNAGTTASTWVMGAGSQTSTVGGVKYDSARIWDYNGSEGYNSFLISPLFTLEAGKTYKVTYNLNVWNDAAVQVQNLDLMLLVTSPIDDAEGALSTGRTLKSYVDLGQSFYKASWNSESVTFSVETAGSYYLSFRCYNYMIKCPQVSAFAIAEVESQPVTPGPDDPVTPPDDTTPLPYESKLAENSTLDAAWTVVNANDDAKTWTGDTKGAKYPYASQSAADDWLISPAFYLEGGKEYKILYKYQTHNYIEKFNTYIAKGEPTPENFKATEPLFEFADKSNGFMTPHSDTFTPAESGVYHVGFWCYSDQNMYNLYLTDFMITENVFYPAKPSSFNAIVAPNRELKVTLNWVNPTQSTLGTPFTEEQTIEEINLYRDDSETPFVTLTETLTTYDDTEALGLTPGFHTYAIDVKVAGVKSEKVTCDPGKYIGPIEPFTLPVALTFAKQTDYDDFWTAIKGEAQESTTDRWKWQSNSLGGYAYYYGTSNKQEDFWLISPPIVIAEAGYYNISTNAYVSSATAQPKLELWQGTECSIEGMVTCLNESLPLTNTNTDVVSVDFKVQEPGTYYFAFRTHGKAPSSFSYSIKDFNLKATEMTPAKVTELSVTPDPGKALTATLTWTCPVESTTGDPIAAGDYRIKVECDGEVLATLPGGTAEYTAEVLEAGVYTFNVITETTAGTTAGAVSVTSTWIGPKTVALPYFTTFKDNDPSVAIWDVVDANGDGKTWAISSASETAVCAQPDAVEGERRYNDWIISPEVVLEPGYYHVNFFMKGGTSNQKLTYKVGVLEAGAYSADRITLLQFEEKQPGASYSTSDPSTSTDYAFKIDEAGTYQIAWGMDTPQPSLSYASYQLTLDGVTIDRLTLVPDVVSELAVTPAPDYVLSATVTWRNPTTSNVPGVTPDLSHALIFRNGEKIDSIYENLVPGELSTYVDNSVAEPGCHTYRVEIYSEGGKSADAAPEVVSEWIGGGLQVPYEVADNGFSTWSVYNVDGDKQSYYPYGDITWEVFGTGLKITKTSAAPDDWAVSPKVELELGKTYEIKLSEFLGYGNTDFAPYEFDVCYSTTSGYEGMQKIATVSVLADAVNINSKQNDVIYIKAVDPAELDVQADDTEPGEETVVNVPAGALNFGLHARSQGAVTVNSFGIYISTVGIDNILADGIGFDRTSGALTFDGVATGVMIADISGKVMFASDKAEGYISLDGLVKGVYVVRFTLDGKVHTLKVVK